MKYYVGDSRFKLLCNNLRPSFTRPKPRWDVDGPQLVGLRLHPKFLLDIAVIKATGMFFSTSALV